MLQAYNNYKQANEPQVVNHKYWYDETDISDMLQAYLRRKDLHCTAKNIGVILNADDSVYKASNGLSFSLGVNLLVCGSVADMEAKLDQFVLFCEALCKFNQECEFLDKHSLIFSLNIGGSHWSLGVLDFQFNFHGFEPTVKLKLLDSIGYPSGIAIGRMINGVLRKITPEKFKLQMSIDSPQVKKQQDVFACGPITVSNFKKLIFNEEIIADNSVYTVDEIYDLRIEHLNLLASEAFTQKQLLDTTVVLQEKAYIDNTDKIFNVLCDFVCEELGATERAKFYTLVSSFVRTDTALEELNQDGYSSTCADIKQLHEDDAENTADIKAWFHRYQERLIELAVLPAIFKLKPDRNVKDELEWTDGGKDTLVLVLRSLRKHIVPQKPGFRSRSEIKVSDFKLS